MSFFSGISSQNNTQNLSAYSAGPKGPVLHGENVSLQTGETVSGKVVALNGDKVTLELPGGVELSAKLEGNMDLKEGQMVAFTAKNTTSGGLVLSPLFTNMNQGLMAQNALSSAGLPVNSMTLSMTSAMMDGEMPISRENLTAMFRSVSHFPESSPQTIVEMNHLGIPVDAENIEHFTAFKNYESQVTDGLRAIASDIPNVIQDLIGKGNDQGAANLLGDVLYVINHDADVETQEVQSQTMADGMPQEFVDKQTMLAEDKVLLKNAETMTDTLKDIANQSMEQPIKEEILSESENKVPSEQTLKNVISDLTKDIPMAEQNTMVKDLPNFEQQGSLNQTQTLSAEINSAKPSDVLPPALKSEVMQLLKESGMDESIIQNYEKTDDFTPVLKAAETLLRKEGLTQPLKELVENPGFQKQLESAFVNQIILKPEDVSKNSVEKLYHKLHNQVEGILQTLQEASPEASSLKTDLSNMSGNMDFMHQMNQTFQYVQIPLKMAGSETTGDLYVYTNKKHLAKSDGSVSALLHLDMTHLGPLDVYASLNPGNQVFTRFYVADDDVLSFLENHMDELTTKLTERGFKVKAETSLHDSNSDIPSILKEPKESESKEVLLDKLSFDMRA